jgi:hypothetical protein
MSFLRGLWSHSWTSLKPKVSFTLKMEAVCFSRMFKPTPHYMASKTRWPQCQTLSWTRHLTMKALCYIPLKCWELLAHWHSGMCQQTWFLNYTAVETSNITLFSISFIKAWIWFLFSSNQIQSKHCPPSPDFISRTSIFILGVCSSAVAWGTALRAGRCEHTQEI